MKRITFSACIDHEDTGLGRRHPGTHGQDESEVTWIAGATEERHRKKNDILPPLVAPRSPGPVLAQHHWRSTALRCIQASFFLPGIYCGVQAFMSRVG